MVLKVVLHTSKAVHPGLGISPVNTLHFVFSKGFCQLLIMIPQMAFCYLGASLSVRKTTVSQMCSNVQCCIFRGREENQALKEPGYCTFSLYFYLKVMKICVSSQCTSTVPVLNIKLD